MRRPNSTSKQFRRKATIIITIISDYRVKLILTLIPKVRQTLILIRSPVSEGDYPFSLLRTPTTHRTGGQARASATSVSGQEDKESSPFSPYCALWTYGMFGKGLVRFEVKHDKSIHLTNIFFY